MLRTPIVSALVVLVLVAPAHGAQDPSDERVTYYLHATFPTNEVEEVLEYTRQGAGPWMDATPPALGQPKVAAQVLGNAETRENVFNSYWSGRVHGTVSSVVATLYMRGAAPTNVSVYLFGDGGQGVAPPIASAIVPLGGGASVPVVVDFGDASASIDAEMVLSIQAQTGTATLFDSIVTPSSLSFDLGEYVPPAPPTEKVPAAGWGAVGTVTRDKAHRETSLAIDPTDPDVMLLCSPSGVPAYRHGHSFFFASKDAGASWADLEVEASPTDARRGTFEGGDCDVAFDAAGTMYVADTWLGSLSVGTSRDGGTTWSGTPAAATAPIVDRPWLVGGPAGTVHVTYQDVQLAMPSVIWYARSTDYGVTFSPAVPVTTSTAAGAFSWQGNFAVSPDGGEIFSVHTRRLGPNRNLEMNGPESVWVSASRDGGVTWTEHRVADMPNPASFLYPSIAMDAGGILHVVFASRTAVDHPVWYAYSRDGARSWSAPVKLVEGVGAYAPWVDGGEAGEAAVQFLASPSWHPQLLATEAPWFVYWARITGAHEGEPTIVAGTTTTTPLFVGKHEQTPEFNTLRIAPDGSLRIGASVYQEDVGGHVDWDILYQTTTG